VPDDRTRPLGTAHAVWCAREYLDVPFGVVNSDDFNGGGSYRALADALSLPDLSACMVGYRLGNTLSETGTVNRGICTIENGVLTGIEERCGIDKNSGVPLDTVVSMNMWGFRSDFTARLDADLRAFLPAMKDPLKDELYLPGVVDGAIRDGSLSVRVLETPEKWYGVTYREDAASLRAAIAKMTAEGKYRA
ncbi:MAG: nucleotidyltransferase, partial [Clostridia bacterium]|nr:nucleotidyltransferase [Clostridia bacterium]